jgi:Zn-dependent peptidase ImmA (M78 family)
MATAAQILDAHWDGNLPVDPRRIARSLGVAVFGQPMEVSGVIEIKDGKPVISYNADEPSVRQRFTIAHEIGHFALGHLEGSQKLWRDPVGNFSSSANKREEREANMFAAQLLMPASTVRYAVREVGITGVAELARMFGVSQVAMGYRLTNLGFVSA